MDRGMEDLRVRMERLLAALDKSEGAGLRPRTSVWPPEDAADLLAMWEELGRPQIPVPPGESISDLERCFSPLYGLPARRPEAIGEVRAFLLEHLPAGEAPESTYAMEEWARTSIPVWRKRLEEAIAAGRNDDVEYARWILKEIFQDPESQEPK